MLETLHIKNVALIEESEIRFDKGFNILSGETGAGKSMVIDSIHFVLGERTSKDFLRKGEQDAQVEALFVTKEKEFQNLLLENGILPEEDGSVLISRTIHASGRSVCRVNGSIVTAGMLKKFSENLIDIHGQHEHQSLLNSSKHSALLDKFCGENIVNLKMELSQLCTEYKKIQASIKELNVDERQRTQRMDILQFQIDEIIDADLKESEEEELLKRKKALANCEKRQQITSNALQLLYNGNERQASVVDLICDSIHDLQELANIDETTIPFRDTLNSIYAQLDDIVREIQKYSGTIESNPEELEFLEERLQLIYHLKRKYGNEVQEILQYLEKIKEELNLLSDSEEIICKLSKKKESIKKEIEKLCIQISAIRKEKAKEIQKEIEKQLWDLEMKNAHFEILVEQKEEFNANGWDRVEFLISPNMGEELKPLAKIASGGEMSRIMLAMKTVFSKADNVETFIFDEIDTGVSGRTAQKVAEKMLSISKNHQILCITHLPQIAAMADRHYFIQKMVYNDRTATKVYELQQKDSIHELARLIGGAKITPATYKAAQEIKELANQIKEQ